MRLDTFIILSKGTAYVVTGFFSPWAAALAQWMNSGSWPPPIAWVVILAVSITGAAASWLAFCSGAWNEFQQQKKANDSGQTQVVETKPTVTPMAIKPIIT